MQQPRRKTLPYFRVQRIDEALMANAMALRILNTAVIMKLPAEEMLRTIAQAIDLVHQSNEALMVAKAKVDEERSTTDE